MSFDEGKVQNEGAYDALLSPSREGGANEWEQEQELEHEKQKTSEVLGRAPEVRAPRR